MHKIALLNNAVLQISIYIFCMFYTKFVNNYSYNIRSV